MKDMTRINDLKKVITTAIYFGACWGIVEAVLGFIIHSIPMIPGMAGFIMFPIGFYFMNRALKSSGTLWGISGTAVIASGIKLLDLFLPGLPAIYTINPAICILIESVAVIGTYKVFVREYKKERRFDFTYIVSSSAAWRIIFFLYSIMLGVLSISTEFIRQGSDHIIQFLLLGTLIDVVLIMMYTRTRYFNSKVTNGIRPLHASIVLVAAITIKYFFIIL